MSAGSLGRIAIVGAGQAGTMLGLALRASGVATEIALHDRDTATAGRSLARGAGDRVCARVEEAFGADVLILALPVSAIVAFLERYGAELQPGTLVIDTGSAKAGVVSAMRRTLGLTVRAVGGHPLAGTERPGPDGADPAALRGAVFALCPVRDDPRALELARALAVAAGARPLVIDADEHDRIVARTSGLPHLLAYALVHATGPLGDSLGALAATGYHGATRLARSDPRMVAAFLSANAAETRAAAAELRTALEALVERLDDEAALAAALGGGR